MGIIGGIIKEKQSKWCQDEFKQRQPHQKILISMDFPRNRDVEETLSKTADFGSNEKYDKLELRNRY